MRVSEKSSEKAKRGRPPLMDDELLAFAGAAGMSRRQKQNRYYAMRAINKLVERHGPEAEETAWLYREHRCRWTILAELGRLAHDDRVFWDAAGWVLDNEPKTAHAVRVVRAFRTGKRPKAASVLGLAEALDEAIERYDKRTTGLTDEQVASALRLVLGCVEAEEDVT